MSQRTMLQALAVRAHRTRTPTYFTDPDPHTLHLHVGADVLNAILTNSNPTYAPIAPSLHNGRVAAFTMFGMDVVDGRDTLLPNQWQIRDQTGTIRSHGTTQDLESEWNSSNDSSAAP